MFFAPVVSCLPARWEIRQVKLFHSTKTKKSPEQPAERNRFGPSAMSSEKKSLVEEKPKNVSKKKLAPTNEEDKEKPKRKKKKENKDKDSKTDSKDKEKRSTGAPAKSPSVTKDGKKKTRTVCFGTFPTRYRSSYPEDPSLSSILSHQRFECRRQSCHNQYMMQQGWETSTV